MSFIRADADDGTEVDTGMYHTDILIPGHCSFLVSREPETAFLIQQLEPMDRATEGPVHIFINFVPWRPKLSPLWLRHVENMEST